MFGIGPAPGRLTFQKIRLQKEAFIKAAGQESSNYCLSQELNPPPPYPGKS